MTVSIPPAMMEEVDRVCEAEHRTRSELVREALRLYFAGRSSATVVRMASPKARRRRTSSK